MLISIKWHNAILQHTYYISYQYEYRHNSLVIWLKKIQKMSLVDTNCYLCTPQIVKNIRYIIEYVENNINIKIGVYLSRHVITTNHNISQL